MTSPVATRDDYGLRLHRTERRAAGLIPRVAPTAASPPAADPRTQTTERRTGERRQRQIPVLLDTRCGERRGPHTRITC